MRHSPPHSDVDEPKRPRPGRFGRSGHSILRGADHDHPTRRDTAPAATVFALMVAALAGAAVLNAEAMATAARGAELGPARDLALAVWEPLEGLGSSVGLHFPRRGLDAVRAADPTGSLISTPPPDPAQPPTDPSSPPSGGDPGDPAVALGGTTAADPGAVAAGSTADPSTPPWDLATSGGAGPTTSAPGAPEGLTEPRPGTTSPAGPLADPAGPTIGRPGAALPSNPASTPASPSGPRTAFALRRPTIDDPLRVLVVGDSTLDTVGTSMLRHLSATEVADGLVDFRVSSGLSRPDFFDWPGHLRAVRPEVDPEVVVIMVGANDAQPFVVGSEVESFGTEAWIETYRSRVRSLLEELTAEGDWVIWIGQPIMRGADFDAKMTQLNQIYREETARHPTALYIDTRTVMSSGDGTYAAYLVDDNGDRIQVRKSDGIHLTTAGGDHLSPLIIAAINELAPLY